MRESYKTFVVAVSCALCLGLFAAPTSTSASQNDWSTPLGEPTGIIQFRDICATPLSSNAFVIRWQTDVPTTSAVEYGRTTAYDKKTVEDPKLVYRHEVVLSGLEENQVYHFRVCGSSGPSYPSSCSPDRTFYTLPPPSPELLNGSFDDFGGDSARRLYPWVQYTTGDDTMGYHPIDGLVGPFSPSASASWFGGIRAFDGSYFLGAAANWGCKNGGVFQRVLWPAGTMCVFSVRYVAFNRGGVPLDTRVRVGIDPNGGVDPSSPSIRWWTGTPSANDNRWYLASVSAVAGAQGIVTVFIDIRQRWELEWHVIAVDHATLTLPTSISIGALKSSLGDFGVLIEQKCVTFMSNEPVMSIDGSYYKGYIEDEERTAGIAVYFDASGGPIPQIGERINVCGSLVHHNMEAIILASSWSTTPSNTRLPSPLGISIKDVGGAETPVQPSLRCSAGLSCVGLRVRVFGRVVWVDSSLPFWNATAIIDDGTAILNQLPPRGTIPRGLRVKLPGNALGVQVGDYIAATGIISIELVDPKPPAYTGDEYFAYTLLVATPEDWHVVTRQ
jgi:hypothetical protein